MMIVLLAAAHYVYISREDVPRPLNSAYNKEMKLYPYHSILKIEQKEVRGKGLDYKFTVDFGQKVGYVIFRITPSNDVELYKITWKDPDAPDKQDL